MVKHKLIHIMQNLSIKEWSDLRKFVLMYTREDSENYKLFSILKKQITSIEKNRDLYLIRQEHFSRISAKSFSNIMSKITKWTENWIVYQSTLNNETEKDLALVKYYNRNGLYKEADAIVQRVEKNITSNEKINIDKNKYLADLYYYHYYSNNPVKFDTSTNLLRLLVNNFMMSVKNKLQLFNIELHNWSELMNIDYGDLNSNIVNIINSLPDSDSSQLLQSLEEMVTNNNLDKYYEIKQSIDKNRIVIDTDLHVILTTYLIKKSHIIHQQDKNTTNQIVLDAYEYGLSSGVLLQSGKLLPFRFINIVGTLAVSGTYESTIDFINRWYTKVKTRDVESIKFLAYANCCIYHDREDEMASHLNKVIYVNSDIRYRREALTSISLYNSMHDDYGTYINHLNNFKRSINRNKNSILKNTYVIYSNFIKIMFLLGESNFKKTDLRSIEIENNIFKTWTIKAIEKRASKNL